MQYLQKMFFVLFIEAVCGVLLLFVNRTSSHFVYIICHGEQRKIKYIYIYLHRPRYDSSSTKNLSFF